MLKHPQNNWNVAKRKKLLQAFALQSQLQVSHFCWLFFLKDSQFVEAQKQAVYLPIYNFYRKKYFVLWKSTAVWLHELSSYLKYFISRLKVTIMQNQAGTSFSKNEIDIQTTFTQRPVFAAHAQNVLHILSCRYHTDGYINARRTYISVRSLIFIVQLVHMETLEM